MPPLKGPLVARPGGGGHRTKGLEPGQRRADRLGPAVDVDLDAVVGAQNEGLIDSREPVDEVAQLNLPGPGLVVVRRVRPLCRLVLVLVAVGSLAGRRVPQPLRGCRVC